MISALVPLLLEAALRALLAAIAVWAGLRLLRVANVLVQKAAWGLVLMAALAMPLLPHWQVLPNSAALKLPPLPWDHFDQLPGSRLVSAPASTLVSVPAATEPSTLPRRDSGTSPSVPPILDRYPAPLISNSNFEVPAGSAPPLRSAPSPAPSSSWPASIPQPGASRPNPTPIRLAALGWILYLGVFAALLLRLLVGLGSALRLWLTAQPVSAPPRSGTAARLRLRTSPRVASPVNIGSGIVLPAGYDTWDEEKLRIVLAHERSHIRQGDFYLQLLAGLYASLFWFSPLGWWLKHKLRELGEAISDRAGLEEAASRSSYAQILLEFAALPRPTLTGVAMARTTNLSQRIERLLNESSFRQAFAAVGRRALLAVLLVPVALFAVTVLVRVEAAASPKAQAQSAQQDTSAGQSTPQQVTDQVSAQAPAPAAAPAPQPAPAAAPAPPSMPQGPAPAPDPAAQPGPPVPPAVAVPPGPVQLPPMPPMPAMEGVAPMQPMPPLNIRIPRDAIRIQIDPEIKAEIAAARAQADLYRAYAHSYIGGDPYAIVGDPGSHVRSSGDWTGDRDAAVEKARKTAHGHFLLFQHDGKSYIVDDPAIVAQVEAMNKAMEDIGSQMRALGKQMRDAGEQQRAIGKQMREITIQAPDLSKVIADMNAAVATLQAKQGGAINEKEIAEMQREMGRIQGQLGALQARLGAQQFNLDGGMGKFGGEMGQLGAQMGQTARENNSKIRGIITDSLGNGKARPVE